MQGMWKLNGSAIIYLPHMTHTIAYGHALYLSPLFSSSYKNDGETRQKRKAIAVK